jgi:hypothetical protein
MRQAESYLIPADIETSSFCGPETNQTQEAAQLRPSALRTAQHSPVFAGTHVGTRASPGTEAVHVRKLCT